MNEIYWVVNIEFHRIFTHAIERKNSPPPLFLSRHIKPVFMLPIKNQFKLSSQLSTFKILCAKKLQEKLLQLEYIKLLRIFILKFFSFSKQNNGKFMGKCFYQ